MQDPVDHTSQDDINGSLPSKMQGFGSADVTTPLYYGSVNDGRIRMDGLEQKLKKQFWKTKQTFIQKLGKDQDDFVTAGDTEIDMKLEKAYHLRSTSIALLQAISKYISKLTSLSEQEAAMGHYLTNWSETEYTNAGEVMKNVGKLQESDSQSRLSIIPALARIQSECAVFQSTAIRDLNFSIQGLEKARTDYRAALLWMKNVSEKLENPDYQNQLSKFREAQATVKDSKVHFEKLKVDLSEKIDMVFASRCNLLSRSLPYYQKEILSFCDNSANAFHKILVDLRSHHHHQYKVQRLLEEIRDLEMEESPITEVIKNEDDVPMLDIGGGTEDTCANTLSSSLSESTKVVADSVEYVEHVKDGNALLSHDSDPFSLEKITDDANVSDLILGGTGVNIYNLQSGMLQPTLRSESSGASNEQAPTDKQTRTLVDDIDSLLNIDESLSGKDNQTNQATQEEVLDEWSSFSAFMSDSQSESLNPHSGWEKEFMAAASVADSDSLMSSGTIPSTPSLQPFAVCSDNRSSSTSTQEGATTSKQPTNTSQEEKTLKQTDSSYGMGSLLMDDLKSLGLDSPERKANIVNPSTNSQDMSGLESLNPLLFQQQPSPSKSSASLPPVTMSQPPLFSSSQLAPGQVPMFRSPLGSSQSPIFYPTYQGPVPAAPLANNLASSESSSKTGEGPKLNSKKGDNQKGNAWMNVFAHLDPLVNEKV